MYSKQLTFKRNYPDWINSRKALKFRHATELALTCLDKVFFFFYTLKGEQTLIALLAKKCPLFLQFDYRMKIIMSGFPFDLG